MKLNINILISKEKKDIDVINDTINISLYKPTNYELTKIINNLGNHLKIYSIIDEIIITFDKSFENKNIQKIVTKLDNIFYSFYPNHTKIKYNNIDTTSQLLVKHLKNYKDITMETDKTPDTYVKYIKNNLPKGYKIKVRKLKDNDKLFPLTSAVGQGSCYNSYFVHIYKKKENKKCKDIVLIGKAITFDSGGLNIKPSEMHVMKIDMTGSAIIINVLNMLVSSGKDKNNIHLLIPIAENMIGSKAIRPGMVIKTLNNKSVEIVDTDAEGRLCMADAIEYFTKYMVSKLKSPILIDIATLTGGVSRVTAFGGVVMCNNKGKKYTEKLIENALSVGEYVEYLELREEYNHYLSSSVADICNYNPECQAGTACAGAFLNYFVNPNIPYIHIDVGCGTIDKNTVNSYGILLLYRFLKKL